jgi:hypothetical protein
MFDRAGCDNTRNSRRSPCLVYGEGSLSLIRVADLESFMPLNVFVLSCDRELFFACIIMQVQEVKSLSTSYQRPGTRHKHFPSLNLDQTFGAEDP